MDSHKSTLIIGNNGAGKSTILDAITFCLYGKPFRNINKPLLINSINGKDCVVEIEFEINGKSFRVVRGLKPNIFDIYINGQLLDQNSKTLEYQDYLTNSILKMSMKSFTQIVILGSASFVPFMQLTPADRRGVIEDLLDIQIFSTMNVLAKQRMQTNKETFTQVNIKLDMLDEVIDLIQKNLTKFRKDNTDKLNSLEENRKKTEQNIELYEESIASLETNLKDIGDVRNKLDAFREKHRTLVKLQAQIKTKHAAHSKNISFYMNNDHCPTCQQEIDQTFKELSVKDLNKKVDEYDVALNQMDTKIQEAIDNITEFDNLLNERSVIQSNIDIKRALIVTENQNLKSIVNQIDQLTNSDTLILDNEKALKEKENDRIIHEKNKTDLIDERQYLDTALQLLKDGGIKAKIIKQYLPIINKSINKYLSQMGFFVDFHIDETFKETIKSRFRDEFSYENFSEGEKMRIDLAILFAWRTVARMKNSVNTNLLILDEVFDSSLDATGTEEFLKIMSDLTEHTNVVVISHKTDALLDKFERTIMFEKYKSFSRIAKDKMND